MRTGPGPRLLRTCSRHQTHNTDRRSGKLVELCRAARRGDRTLRCRRGDRTLQPVSGDINPNHRANIRMSASISRPVAGRRCDLSLQHRRSVRPTGTPESRRFSNGQPMGSKFASSTLCFCSLRSARVVPFHVVGLLPIRKNARRGMRPPVDATRQRRSLAADHPSVVCCRGRLAAALAAATIAASTVAAPTVFSQFGHPLKKLKSKGCDADGVARRPRPKFRFGSPQILLCYFEKIRPNFPKLSSRNGLWAAPSQV